MIMQVLLDLLKFVFAQHAVVHEDAGQAVPDGAMDQYSGDGGVYPAAQGANGPTRTDGFTNRSYGLINKFLSSPVGFDMADFKDKIAQQLSSYFGVVHFGLDLYRENLFLLVFHGGQRSRSLGGELEAGGQVEGLVSVRHPYLR